MLCTCTVVGKRRPAEAAVMEKRRVIKPTHSPSLRYLPTQPVVARVKPLQIPQRRYLRWNIPVYPVVRYIQRAQILGKYRPR